MASKTNTFSKTNRLIRKSEFLNLRKVSRKFSGRHWTAFFVKKEDGVSRLGLSVSSRYGGAVARNQFKRWAREWFRKNWKEMKLADLHIVAKGRAPSRVKAAKIIYKQQFNEDLEKLAQYLSK